MREVIVILLSVFALGGAVAYQTVRPPEKERNAASQPAEQKPALIQPAKKQPQVIVRTPIQGDRIRSPLIITGKAPSSWFFEATFPIRLEDEKGVVLGRTNAKAKGDWMGKDAALLFEARLEFTRPGGEKGVLILENDNPSDLPEKKESHRIPIRFDQKSAKSPTAKARCIIGGCSGEICSDRSDLVSACLYSPEFACYKNARCERQKNGECGWTETKQLAQCLNRARQHTENNLTF